MKSPLLLALCAYLSAGPVTFAQGTKADYERALSLAKVTENTVFRTRVEPHWLPDNTAFWYRNDLADRKREFVYVDAAKGERRPAFDHATLAASLSQAVGQVIDRERLPLDRVQFDPAADVVRFSAAGKPWQFNLAKGELSPASSAALAPVKRELKPRPSRNGGDDTTISFINHTAGEVQCYWMDTQGGRKRYATLKPNETFEQHTFVGHVWMVQDADRRVLGVFEAQDGGGEVLIDPTPEEPAADQRPSDAKQRSETREWRVFIRDCNVFARRKDSGEEIQLSRDGTADDPYAEPFLWSPDGGRFVARQVRKGDERKIQFIESSPKDQLQPKLHEISYAKPGDKIAQERPRLFDINLRQQVPIKEELFQNSWDIGQMRWAPDGSRFTFLFNQRGHQVMRVIAVDASTGEARGVVQEQSSTFIDYSQKTFLHWLDETNELIWASERDGWNHLYLYDSKNGQVKNQITRGEWVVRGVERVDAEKRQVWFSIAGVRPGEDPYYVHLARVNFDGSGLVVLTEGDGTHKWAFSPDGKYLIDSWSRVDLPPVTVLRESKDGRLVCELERADASALLAKGWSPVERFVAKGRDGKTDIYGVITRPSNFDPAKKYPIIENIYAGPHGFFVPKEWRRELRHHLFAELGFIVVQIDGMGTNWRSKTFHDVCWKNLADAGFPDRIAWLKAAAAKYPEMDLSRVGIFGGSAGGQNALGALLFHGDFYKVAVADCGCHDNRMDKIWWNEAWMGWPIGPEYAASSNVTNAHRLQGKLLLTVGEMDTNVDPASTMQVVNALIKADKDFDLLVVPGANHGAGESPYASRRRMDFFVRNLLGVEPRM
ncbi:prolyl oligopeptidase family serine peptidase [Verrucomicrobiota bacterium sgz303538]